MHTEVNDRMWCNVIIVMMSCGELERASDRVKDASVVDLPISITTFRMHSADHSLFWYLSCFLFLSTGLWVLQMTPKTASLPRQWTDIWRMKEALLIREGTHSINLDNGLILNSTMICDTQIPHDHHNITSHPVIHIYTQHSVQLVIYVAVEGPQHEMFCQLLTCPTIYI